SKLNFYKIELIGYDFGFLKGNTIGTWIAFQKKKNSGKIINVCSTNWCANEGMKGKDSQLIKKITLNMIDKLYNNENIFVK
ncbi:MAG: hypothetical protein JKY33_10360, partial [Bacteroidia bacterium]|nr:hypothetical protein [Bacteroidia bacterium]